MGIYHSPEELKKAREVLKRSAWISNVMSKLGYTKEEAEAAWKRIYSKD